jgi:hypothetical protein
MACTISCRNKGHWEHEHLQSLLILYQNATSGALHAVTSHSYCRCCCFGKAKAAAAAAGVLPAYTVECRPEVCDEEHKCCHCQHCSGALCTQSQACCHLLLLLQDQGSCSACVGFAVTAAAEAAINVYKQQSWNKLGLSEQDLSFCRCACS